MDSRPSSSSVLEPELYFLIARFLSAGPCQRTSRILLEELEEFKLLPRRVDWEGNEHFRSYDNLVYLNRHIRSDHLLRIVDRVGTLVDKEVKSSVPGVRSLLGAGSLSILRTAEGLKHTRWNTVHHTIKQHGASLYPPRNLTAPFIPHVVQGFQVSGSFRQHSVIPTSAYNKISMQGRKLGHLSAVYCVLFDRTGNYIFTGADDTLVKIWSIFDMRLLATLRGHSAEITDMAVSFENTILASGSCDKTIRVWCLRSKAPIAVLQNHTSMITSVQFCPKTQGDIRYLLSTGNDGCVCFWQYSTKDRNFNQKPIKFIEKSRAGAQMLCSSFSPGGAFLATGNSDHTIRVYFLHAAGPEKICELEAHTDKVDSICYSNHHNRFISGSTDGSARIWRFEKHEWRATVLHMTATLQGTSPATRCVPNPDLRVTMVSWTVDDNKVITADSNLTIKIWDSYTGILLQILEGHEDEVYVLEACPTDNRILLSAGHDGKLIIWDINTGVKVKKFFNLIEGQGHGGVFDGKFSQNGQYVAATDSHGHMLLLGFGTNDRCKKLPQQLFFHTDYRPLMRDANNFVLDEQTQQPPHLMPPPFLVDIDGNPYPAAVQRCVPGREHCKETSLIPQMAINEVGESEVIGEQENEDAQRAEESTESDDGDGGDGERRPGAVAASRVRPSIDILIEELQRQQDHDRVGDPGPSGVSTSNQHSPRANGDLRSPGPFSPPTPRSNMQNRIGMRSSGQIEGVRQSLGHMAVVTTKKEREACRRRVTVKPLDESILQLAEQKRAAFSEEEVKRFLAERKLKPGLFHENAKGESSNKGRRQTKKNPNEDGAEVAARNRLTTRALYDTEEEEDEGGGSELDMYASDSHSSDDYSDWIGDQGSSNLEPPKRRSQRKVKRRRLSSSEEDNDVEVEDEDTEVQDSSSDEDSNEEKGESSTDRATRSARRESTPTRTESPTRIESPTRRGSPRKSKQHNNINKSPSKRQPKKKPKKVKKDLPVPKDIPEITELDEKMRPSEWITTVIPRKAPFVPQMGDEVIYFRQGHQQYLNAVVRKDVYPVEEDENQPWHKIPQLRAQELVKIVGIKWLLKPIRLCCLKLAFMDTNSGKLTGKSFTIRYHDMPDVIDFIVLKQHYDISVERAWKPGMKFRSMIEDQWWIGAIRSQEPFGLEFPDSLYQCFNVHWDNGEFEKLSPWDMEPVDPKRSYRSGRNACLPQRNSESKPSKVGAGVDVTQAEYKKLLYVPKKTEWTSIGREAESARLVSGMEALMQHSFAEPFIAPVDLQQFPSYAYFVAYPIDLSTIKARLENGFYRRITALQWDVRLIHANAHIFNESESTIVKNAYALTEALLRFIKDHDCEDPMPLLTELSRGDIKIGSSDEDSQNSRRKTRDSTNRKHRSSKSRVKQNPDEWLEQCGSLLAMLFDCEDSTPFRTEVDPEEYPDYADVVTNPMDLNTVHTKLASGQYGNPLDLSKDMRLIFSNSKHYNTNKRSRIYSMTLRLSALFEDQISHIITSWKSALRASGRLEKLKKPHRSKLQAKPSTSYNGISQAVETAKPTSSKAASTSTRARLINGHSKGLNVTESGDDSDATIVDKAGTDEDGADTEVYEDEYNGRVYTKADTQEDEAESDNDTDDYLPSTVRASKGKSSKGGKAKCSKPLPTRTSSGRLTKSNIFYASDYAYEDDDDDDIKEVVNFKEKRRKINNLLNNNSDKPSSKSSKGGKLKGSKPLPTRTSSGRLAKSNVFYASDGYEDEDDEDKEEIVNFKEKRRKVSSQLNDNNDKHSSKSSKGGKAKCSKPLPTRTSSGRLAKSNLFYASDDHSDGDFEDNEEMGNFKEKRQKSNAQLNGDSDKPSSDEDSESPFYKKKMLTKKSSFSQKNNPEEQTSLRTKSKDIPSHRKTRAARSNKLNDSEDEEKENLSLISPARSLKRSARSARQTRTYYGESEGEGEQGSKIDNSNDESSSSHTIDNYSEDDSPNKTRKKPSRQNTKSPVKQRREIKITVCTDSDSDAPVPRKRIRLGQSKSPNKKSPVLSNSPAKKGIKGRGGAKKIQTRNKGRQKVIYNESDSNEELLYDDDEGNNKSFDRNSDSDEDDSVNLRTVSSRGRVRKITARAKACFRNL